MKVKSILASLGACAIATSALALTAFAGEVPIKNATEADGKYAYSVGDHLPEGKKISDVYGAEVKLSGVDTTAGAGGGIILQSDSAGWNQKEWGNEGSGKDCIYDYTSFTFKRLESAAPFADSDTWASIVISQWDGWGEAVTVESVTLLGKDGNALTAGSSDDKKDDNKTDNTTATTAATTKAAGGNTTKAGATKTGDAGVGIAISGLALAGIAAVASRKKH